MVVDQLARGLVDAGCEVSLFCTADSSCPVSRRWCLEHPAPVMNDSHLELLHVQEAYRALRDVDVIHDHTFLGPLWATAAASDSGEHPPVVATLHGLMTEGQRRLCSTAARRCSFVAISASQRRTAPDLPVAAVIHHGIEIERLPFGDGSAGYVLFLGRMSPDKGAHRAIAAARGAGVRIKLAAKMREPEEIRYFRNEVEPLLGSDAVYVGEVGGDRKADLLAGAAALVNPIRWNEPFGLVMIEALACGTPVVSFDEGAAGEIIRPGLNGYLCTDEREMARRIGQVDRIDRRECRADALERFSSGRMVRDHLELYRRVTAGSPASATFPGSAGT
jgi:glycosyltransferase involved in cell wall biosynthesis